MAGGVGDASPFSGALWDQAKAMVAKNPKGLSDEQLLKLVESATADGTVTKQEADLLHAVAAPENVQKIVKAMAASGKQAGFDVSGLNLGTPRAAAIDVNVATGLAGKQIQATYDPTAEDRRPAIQATAAATKVGPKYGLTMKTEAGRDAILDKYGQLMGTAVYGRQACGAASLMALAINAGPAALGALAQIVRNDHPYDKTWAAFCDKFANPDAEFTLQDLAALQDALLDRMLTEQSAAGTPDGKPDEGLSTDTLLNFISTHQKELEPLFAGGASILPVDNTGDGAMDHYVAYVPKGGKDRVFEPWEPKSGHHLVTDPVVLRRYAAAMPK